MSDKIKELVKRLAAGRTLLLRADGDRDLGFQSNITTDASMALADELKSAIDALEAMAGEVERLNKLNDELDTAASERLLRAFAAEAERDRLKAVGFKILAKLDHPTASVTQWDADELRAALGGDA